MSVDQQEPSACTFVELHEVDGDGVSGTPAALPLQKAAGAGPPILVIVGGPFAHKAARAQGIRIAMRQTGDTLRVAVFEIQEEPAPPEEGHLDELHAAFHAVVVVARGQRERAVRALVRTILRLDGQDQWISCDWHDVSQILRNSRGAAARSGCGHGTGGERAVLATLDAIRQADRQGSGLRAARGICVGIRGASTTIHGREIKEVIHQIRARIPTGATITMSIGSDSALDYGSLGVDIFAFGEFDEAELAKQGADGGVVADAAHGPDAAWQGEDASRDPLYEAARSLVMQNQRASISLVQRHLRIGYRRASQLLVAMKGGILPAGDEGEKRAILVPDETAQRPAKHLD